eukprot:TRINITY_DN2561_c0_g1_i1.p1 TRINITY_DN2561_c0_g1~~TRINITY_DN2561_c0_g1_i1.p1  ORF type:complete len:365 (+),score=106.92 TRINITY_DN2561_c0_g1_i1:108-1202(+)
MALAQNVQIAREKYSSQAHQSDLIAAVERQAGLRAGLCEAQATQRILEAKLKRQQAVRGQEIALQDFKYHGQDFEGKKITILLQGFRALTHIYRNIMYTSALFMGSAAAMLCKSKVNNALVPVRFVLWGLGLAAITVFTQVLYMAALSITDSTKLAFQGTKATDDVERAFHGLIAMRSEVFWTYVAGCMVFMVQVNFVVWGKLDNDAGSQAGKHDFTRDEFTFGVVLSCCLWAIFTARMTLAFRWTRRTFKLDYDGATFNLPHEHGAEALVHHLDMADDFSVSLGPQTLRKNREKVSPARSRRSSMSQFSDGSMSPGRSHVRPSAAHGTLQRAASQESWGPLPTRPSPRAGPLPRASMDQFSYL